MTQPIIHAPLTFLQIHIDAARNSTDDFNLFHDRVKWGQIQGNPFGGPIALGFQLECLIEDQLRLYREQNNETAVIEDNRLRFSNYQFTFTSVVKPGETVQVEIKKSQLKPGENTTLSNRIAIKNERGIVIFGFKKESQAPLFLSDTQLSSLPDLSHQPDRSYLDGTGLFYKRKFMSNGNAKNFLSGSLADQSAYFDELEERIRFPEIYPAGLISCALLERALKNHHDFEREPMVYTTHNISIDRELTTGLRSNDVLHLLVDEPTAITTGEYAAGVTQYLHHCFGVLQNGAILFRAEITMMPLAAILKTTQ
jgi:acyl dehydratase